MQSAGNSFNAFRFLCINRSPGPARCNNNNNNNNDETPVPFQPCLPPRTPRTVPQTCKAKPMIKPEEAKTPTTRVWYASHSHVSSSHTNRSFSLVHGQESIESSSPSLSSYRRRWSPLATPADIANQAQRASLSPLPDYGSSCPNRGRAASDSGVVTATGDSRGEELCMLPILSISATCVGYS